MLLRGSYDFIGLTNYYTTFAAVLLPKSNPLDVSKNLFMVLFKTQGQNK
jgi:hypothetical protein